MHVGGVSEVIIETRDLHRSYRIGKKSIEVLHGVNLSIRKGEKVFLCGPSGAGKSVIAGELVERSGGRLYGRRDPDQ